MTAYMPVQESFLRDLDGGKFQFDALLTTPPRGGVSGDSNQTPQLWGGEARGAVANRRLRKTLLFEGIVYL